ncbi:MAG: ribonuclease III family protein [Euryarchaeota archaeon]|nr:ribonuclease III family protein [Euryarchaeota archaeon]
MSLEKFGDAFVNFIYSLAKSLALGKYDGMKVPNSSLAIALTNSNVRSPRRSDKHKKGDYVEKTIAKAWINGKITQEECVEVLRSVLVKYDLGERIKEKKAIAEAFTSLLNEIKKRD